MSRFGRNQGVGTVCKRKWTRTTAECVMIDHVQMQRRNERSSPLVDGYHAYYSHGLYGMNKTLKRNPAHLR